MHRFLATAPKFPGTMLKRGIGGYVRARYVVDEHGRIEPSSVRMQRYSDPAFVQPAIDALLASRFTPARAGGCPVKMMVEQVVRFTIQR